MDQQTKQPLEPRMEAGKALVIAGYKGVYSKATVGDIPTAVGVVRHLHQGHQEAHRRCDLLACAITPITANSITWRC